MIGQCSVCGKKAEVFVAASACGATSFAYCADCFKAGVEPYGELVAYISLAGNRPEDINDAYLKIVRDTCSHLKIPEEQFWHDVKEMDSYWDLYNESLKECNQDFHTDQTDPPF